MALIDELNRVSLSSFWEILLGAAGGGLFALVLVYFVEWLRTPRITIEKAADLELSDRKLLKVRVAVDSGRGLRRMFPSLWKRPAVLALLQVHVNGINKPLFAKWDSAPEPFDYQKNQLRLEMMPEAYRAENLIVGDDPQAGIAMKHQGEGGFYIFDPLYYVPWERQKVALEGKQVEIALKFRSASATETRTFIIVNASDKLHDFQLQPIH